MKEIFSDKVSIDELKKAICGLASDWQPIVIRAGNGYTKHDWKKFLMNDCGFSLDRRHYGFSEGLESSDWWEISYQPDKATSYAYSNTKQPFHTDNSWFSDPAEIDFFIMEKQAVEGGEQLIYPIERLIDDLSKEHQGLLDDLKSIEVIIRKGDGEHFNKTSIIMTDPELRIFWNYYRTEKNSLHIIKMCEAFFKFLSLKESSSSIERLYCKSGDSFCFNDLKILHARSSFTASKPRDRILLQSMWKFK